MKDAIPSIPLADGSTMPSIGLGLWKMPKAEGPDVVEEAVRCGFRHFDSACDYGNEVQTGEGLNRAISKGLCTREDLWVTSKLWCTYHDPKHVRPALERTLSDLGLDTLDLYLVHFPISLRYVPFETRYPPEWTFDPTAEMPRMEEADVLLADTWAAMEELKSAGLVKHIGVSNFSTVMLRELLKTCRQRPEVLQIELHPYLPQEKLIRFCHAADIAVTGFSPLGAPSYVPLGMADASENIMNENVVLEAAKTHSKTPAQILLRWALQRGTAVVPKTSRPERLKENLAVQDFVLSECEMAAISGLNRNRRFNDPGDFAEAAFNTFFPIYD